MFTEIIYYEVVDPTFKWPLIVNNFYFLNKDINYIHIFGISTFYPNKIMHTVLQYSSLRLFLR